MRNSTNHCLLAVFLLFLILAGPVTAADHACPDSARTFWKSFRGTVLGKDPLKVTKYVRFPFELRGTLDSSQKRDLDRTGFVASFPLLLHTDPGLSPEPSTMKALVKKTAVLSKFSCNTEGNQIRVGTWVFEKKSGGWLFVRAYIED